MPQPMAALIRDACLIAGTLLIGQPAAAQFPDLNPLPQIAPWSNVDEVPAATRAQLTRIAALLGEEQYDEALDGLLREVSQHGDKLVRWEELPLAPRPAEEAPARRYLPLRKFAQAWISSWAYTDPPALASYRRRFDPPAARRLAAAAAETSRREALERIVEDAFATSSGDNALLALGDLHLAEGRPHAARLCWERISPTFRSPGDSPVCRGWPEAPWGIAAAGIDLDEHWKTLQPALTSSRPARTWMAYPDSEIPLADVWARFVLASILDGDRSRAAVELELLSRLFPDARGELGGSDVVYAAHLRDLVDSAASWPSPRSSADWPTFAGNYARNRVVPATDFGGVRTWEQPIELEPIVAGDRIELGRLRVAEDIAPLLSYHPVIAGNRLLVPTENGVAAYDLTSGKKQWGPTPLPDVGPIVGRGARPRVGAPRRTATIDAGRIFVRHGWDVTGSQGIAGFAPPPHHLDVRGLATGGALVRQWPEELVRDPDERVWFLEGSPIVVDGLLYISMRKSGEQPRQYVACYDWRAGRLRWRTFICGGESVAQAFEDEVTHNLLTLAEDTLYVNTNLGASAALDRRTGSIRWLTTWAREVADLDETQQIGLHWYRDVNPCVFAAGLVYTAPRGAPRLFAHDAGTGQLAWITEAGRAVDAVHLLGVAGGNLIASGDSLYWFDAVSGQPRAQFPPPGSRSAVTSKPSPHGYGRGLLVGDQVWWPTLQRIHVFPQRIATPGAVRPARQPIELGAHGFRGGNLLIARGHLLLVGPAAIQAIKLE